LSFVFLTVSESNESTHPKDKEGYNVILIIIDDLRPDHLGCYGYANHTSPAIDKVAKDSFIFDNVFSQFDYTIASTMSIFTSLYPSSHGVLFVRKDKLSARVLTMPEIFNIYGYKTALFSNLKEPHLDIKAGFGRGFQNKVELGIQFEGRDELLSWIQKNKAEKFFLAMHDRRVHDYYLFINNFDKVNKRSFGVVDKSFYHKLIKLAKSQKPPFDDPKIYLEHRSLFNGSYADGKTEQITQLVAAEKRAKLEEMRGILQTSWIENLGVKDTKSWIAAYDACIQAVDKELIEPIIMKLKALGLYDKTVLIITADHGESFGEHGFFGHGFGPLDVLLRVPLIIKMPNTKEGKRIKELIQSIDIMPTLLETTEIKVPHQAQGRSFIGLMTTGDCSSPLHKYIFAEGLEAKSIRSQEWKLLIVFGREKKLFHISLDPEETHDVYSQNRDIGKKLEIELNLWESSLTSYKDKEYLFSPEIDKAGQERIRKTGYW
jgi:arylsulfatase A-like enzyme